MDETNLSETRQHSETLLGFESANNTVSFINGIDANNTGNDTQPLQQTSFTMMGFEQNEQNDEEPQYTDNQVNHNQDIMLFGKILQYNKLTKSYSIQLKSNCANVSQTYTIQIPTEYIHSVPRTSNVEYKVFNEVNTKYTKNQNDIILHKDPYYDVRKDLKCTLSLYASDAINIEIDENLNSIQRFYHNIYESSKPIGDICANMFRISPFGDNKVLSNNKNDEIISVKQWVQYDKKHEIYYYHLGHTYTEPPNQIFFTPKFKWPDCKYSVAMWVEWKNNYLVSTSFNTILTTFDSLRNAPIYVDNKGRIGCHSQNGREALSDYTVQPGWNFVVALGSTNNTQFFIGNLDEKPEFLGSIELSVCGQETERIGERDQGPGKLGFIAVFDGHLNKNEMEQLYHESISEMQGTWNTQQTQQIKQLILSFCDGIQEIVHVTMSYAKYTKF